MNKTIRTILCLTLCGVMLLGLCACGEEPVSTESTLSPENYHPEDSYMVNKNGEGDYDYKVLDYAGNTIFFREHEAFAPEFATLTESVLQVAAPMSNNPSMRWAVFCDVRSQKVSDVYGNFLGAKGGYVAQLEFLTDQHHVMVREIFGTAPVPHKVVTLEGLVPNKDNHLYEKVELTEDGNLEITYETKKGKKTTVVEMP